MSGPSIHIAVSERVATHLSQLQKSWLIKLPDVPCPTPADLSAITQKHPNYYALGAVGPDISTLLPDFRGQIAGMPKVNMLIGALETLDELYENLDE